MYAFAGVNKSDENSYKVTYDGGSVPGLKAGETARLVIEPKQFKLVTGKDKDLRELVVGPPPP